MPFTKLKVEEKSASSAVRSERTETIANGVYGRLRRPHQQPSGPAYTQSPRPFRYPGRCLHVGPGVCFCLSACTPRCAVRVWPHASTERQDSPCYLYLSQEPNVRVQAPASPFSPSKAPKTATSRIASSFPSAGSDVAIGPPPVCFQLHADATSADKKSHTMALMYAGAALVALGSMMSAGMHMYSAAPSSSYSLKRCGYTSVTEWRANAAGVDNTNVRLHACMRVSERTRTCIPCSGVRPGAVGKRMPMV